jgi:transcriptional regulator with XRE-family HTH domain
MVAVAKSNRRPTGFGPRLRETREAAGVSQTELGQRTGIAYQTIAKYERGVNEPTWPIVCLIADALGVPTDQLRDPPAAAQPEAPPRRRKK